MGTRKFNAWSNPAMNQRPIQGDPVGNFNTRSRLMLQNPHEPETGTGLMGHLACMQSLPLT